MAEIELKPINVRMFILDLDYIVEYGKPVVRIWGKTRDGKNIVVFDRGFRPYFYVEPRGDIEELKERIVKGVEGIIPEDVEVVGKKLYGKQVKLLKITLTLPLDVPNFRDIVKEWDDVKSEYEYGISLHRRYLVDNNLIPTSWVEVEGYKLKTDLNVNIALGVKNIKNITLSGYPKLNILAFNFLIFNEEGEDKIIMASVLDNKGFKKTISFSAKKKLKGLKIVKDEEELIKEFIKIVKKRNPDIILTYEGDRVVFPALDLRGEKHKVDLGIGRDNKKFIFIKRAKVTSPRMAGRIHIDLYEFIENILSSTLSSEVITLDQVSKEMLGIEKSASWEQLKGLWKENKIDKVYQECNRISDLILKLSNHILPQLFELSNVDGQILFDVNRMTYSQLVEWLLIRKAFEVGELVPSRPPLDEIKRRLAKQSYTGGYVYTPKRGIHENICLFDFKSLYPSIIITHHISPETFECGCCYSSVSEKTEDSLMPQYKNKVPDEDYYFCTKHEGFIPEVIEKLVEKRTEINKLMETIKPGTLKYKGLYNRQYAMKILSNASYGYYGFSASRWYSTICAKSITAWGRYYIKKVIELAEKKYDVIYGDTDSLFLKMKNEKDIKNFLYEVNKILPKTLELEFKNLYKSGLFVLSKSGTVAKKRYALIDKSNNMVIRGFEKVRRNWSKIAKDTQEKILLATLKDRSPEKGVKIVKKTINNLKKGKIKLDELIIYTKIAKPLDKYEQIGPHVAAALKAVKRGKVFEEGSTIAYIITKGVGSISDRAEIAEFVKNYDPEYYIHNQVIPAALRVLAEFGYKEEDLIPKKGSKTQQASLDRFVKQPGEKNIKKFFGFK